MSMQHQRDRAHDIRRTENPHIFLFSHLRFFKETLLYLQSVIKKNFSFFFLRYLLETIRFPNEQPFERCFLDKIQRCARRNEITEDNGENEEFLRDSFGICVRKFFLQTFEVHIYIFFFFSQRSH